ncbi:MAG: HlyD family efflux transporter periplasmic adaptor subunit [Thermoguttaceae bacterium]|nr:HlyD family efflux transporter periplasmic adaptor subunit [Thermoguttaceae bacterium]
MTKNLERAALAFFLGAAVAFCGNYSSAQDDYLSDIMNRDDDPTGSFESSADSFSTGIAPPTNLDAPSSSSKTVDGKIVVYNAKVEIPKGEGYEAIISANGQGLLDELRLYDDNYDLAAELRALSEHIAGEIAQEQSQMDASGKQKETEKTTDPERARQDAVDDVDKQFSLLDRFGIAEKGESDRPQLRRGMVVRKGQYLGRLQDDELKQEFVVALQELLVARKEAEKTLEVDVAVAAAKVAQASFKRADSLNKSMPGSISPEEVDEKYYDWIRAAKSIEKARYDLEVNKEKVKVSLARANATLVQIRNRKLRSPMDGFIDEIYQNEGQWVREGDQVLHILRLDKVQVTGAIDASKNAPEDVDGKTIVVKVKRPGQTDAIKLTGKVVYVRQVVESGHYYFYAEVENQTIRSEQTGKDYWVLNPGSLVDVEVEAN